jgi:hypothetical protein
MRSGRRSTKPPMTHFLFDITADLGIVLPVWFSVIAINACLTWHMRSRLSISTASPGGPAHRCARRGVANGMYRPLRTMRRAGSALVAREFGCGVRPDKQPGWLAPGGAQGWRINGAWAAALAGRGVGGALGEAPLSASRGTAARRHRESRVGQPANCLIRWRSPPVRKAGRVAVRSRLPTRLPVTNACAAIARLRRRCACNALAHVSADRDASLQRFLTELTPSAHTAEAATAQGLACDARLRSHPDASCSSCRAWWRLTEHTSNISWIAKQKF